MYPEKGTKNIVIDIFMLRINFNLILHLIFLSNSGNYIICFILLTCVAQSDSAPGPVPLENLVENDAERVDVSFLSSSRRSAGISQQLWRSP